MKLIDFCKRFDSEQACEKHLKAIREKEGVVCSKCGGKKHYWDKASKSWRCAHCCHETTLTAGTVMHGSKLPLMYWFTAMHLTATKKTISASEMQRQLGHKRYQPIWEMMHKLRSVMGQRDGKYKLSGTIELDEGYFTTDSPLEEDEPLKSGIGSQRKSKVMVMVESEKTEHPRKGESKKFQKRNAYTYIVSASVEDWIAPVASYLKVDKVLGTKVEVNSEGKLTGFFSTENCYGQEKVNRFLKEEPNRDEYYLYAYGDSRGDKEMIAFADEGFWV